MIREVVKDRHISLVVVHSCWSRGTSIRVVTSDPVLRDRLHHYLQRHPTGFPRNVVRQMIKETNEIKDMIKNEKQKVFSMMEKGGGLHDQEEVCGVYIDDISGQVLDSKAVEVARRSELKTFKEMEVYEHLRREGPSSRGKVVGVRWVDSLKGAIVKSRPRGSGVRIEARKPRRYLRGDTAVDGQQVRHI